AFAASMNASAPSTTRSVLPANRALSKVARPEVVRLGLVSIVRVLQRQDARPETFEVGQAAIKSVFANQRRVPDVALPAHMPFAKMTGRIAESMKLARQNRRAGIEPLRHAAFVIAIPVREVRGDAPPLRILARR